MDSYACSWKFYLSLPNCFLNHSPLSCLFIISSILLSSVDFFSTLKISFLLDVKLPPAFFEINPTTSFSQLNTTIKDLATILYNSQKPIDSCTQYQYKKEEIEHCRKHPEHRVSEDKMPQKSHLRIILTYIPTIL